MIISLLVLLQEPDALQDTCNLVIQGEQKVSVHLIITIQKVASNFQSVPRQSSEIY
jgi:hypothetical protein